MAQPCAASTTARSSLSESGYNYNCQVTLFFLVVIYGYFGIWLRKLLHNSILPMVLKHVCGNFRCQNLRKELGWRGHVLRLPRQRFRFQNFATKMTARFGLTKNYYPIRSCSSICVVIFVMSITTHLRKHFRRRGHVLRLPRQKSLLPDSVYKHYHTIRSYQ